MKSGADKVYEGVKHRALIVKVKWSSLNDDTRRLIMRNSEEIDIR